MSKAQSNFNKALVSLTPDTLIDLYEIDFSNLQPNFEMFKDVLGANFGADTVYRFCPMKNSSNPIYWQGKAFQPLPVAMEGFEQQGDGRLPRPKITIANPEGLLSKIVHANFDFANCKVTRKRTFARFLDDDNFIDPGTKNDAGKNPFGEANPNSHYPDDVFFINKKSSENKNIIQFELVSSLELEGTEVPARIVLPNYCGWVYRCSIGCGYKGLPIETASTEPLTTGFSKESGNTGAVAPGLYPNGIDDVDSWDSYGKNGTEVDPRGYDLGDVVKIIPRNADNPYKSTPSVFVCIKGHALASAHHPFFDKNFWAKDECNKTLEACKKRFSPGKLSEYNKIDKTYPGIRFGGFPGTDKHRPEAV